MRRRLFRSRRFAILLTWMLVLDGRLAAQTCRGNLSSALVGHIGTTCHGGGCPDNKVHIRIKVDDTGGMDTVIRAAIDQWNQLSHLTNTVFDYDSNFPQIGRAHV